MNDLDTRTLFGNFMMVYYMTQIGPKTTELTLNHTKMQKLIHSGEKYDVLVLVQLRNEALKLLGPHFGAHIVSFCTFGPYSYINYMISNPTPLSYVPEYLLGYSTQMNFTKRLINVCMHIFTFFVLQFYQLREHERMAKQYIPNSGSLYPTIFNVSLVLLNSQDGLHGAAPYVPVMKNIGGFHITERKKLPNDLQEFLDTSKNGVIYFSMGSNLKSANFKSQILNTFIQSFAKLQQNVLWKFENENLTGLPENVKISKWLPQQDILGKYSMYRNLFYC